VADPEAGSEEGRSGKLRTRDKQETRRRFHLRRVFVSARSLHVAVRSVSEEKANKVCRNCCNWVAAKSGFASADHCFSSARPRNWTDRRGRPRAWSRDAIFLDMEASQPVPPFAKPAKDGAPEKARANLGRAARALSSCRERLKQWREKGGPPRHPQGLRLNFGVAFPSSIILPGAPFYCGNHGYEGKDEPPACSSARGRLVHKRQCYE
jgi:hypothetical protein